MDMLSPEAREMVTFLIHHQSDIRAALYRITSCLFLWVFFLLTTLPPSSCHFLSFILLRAPFLKA